MTSWAAKPGTRKKKRDEEEEEEEESPRLALAPSFLPRTVSPTVET
jgi:hypothetical protein